LFFPAGPLVTGRLTFVNRPQSTEFTLSLFATLTQALTIHCVNVLDSRGIEKHLGQLLSVAPCLCKGIPDGSPSDEP
jgi:hypothetical protein